MDIQSKFCLKVRWNNSLYCVTTLPSWYKTRFICFSLYSVLMISFFLVMKNITFQNQNLYKIRYIHRSLTFIPFPFTLFLPAPMGSHCCFGFLFILLKKLSKNVYIVFPVFLILHLHTVKTVFCMFCSFPLKTSDH